MSKDCLYCGLQFSDTTHFCSNCGRPTESGFTIRPARKTELDYLRRQLKETNELIRQLALAESHEGTQSTLDVTAENGQKGRKQPFVAARS